jgi:hypothetical protein
VDDDAVRLILTLAIQYREPALSMSNSCDEAIDHFICGYNGQAAPFEWRQTEIKQQPLHDNIAYFRQ